MTDRKLSRREFLERAMALGLATTGVAATLAACDAPSDKKPVKGAAKAAEKKPAAPAAKALNCAGTDGLSDPDKQTRVTFKYVDKSPEAAKNCANCQLYVVAKAEGSCGGCQIVKGTINPAGYCTAWQAKQGG